VHWLTSPKGACRPRVRAGLTQRNVEGEALKFVMHWNQRVSRGLKPCLRGSQALTFYNGQRQWTSYIHKTQWGYHHTMDHHLSFFAEASRRWGPLARSAGKVCRSVPQARSTGEIAGEVCGRGLQARSAGEDCRWGCRRVPPGRFRR
jgi:hypothetical protein